MFSFDLLSFFEKIIPKWYRRSTLFLVLLISAVFSLYFLSVLKFENLSPQKFCIVSSVLICVIILWYFTTKIPKATKGKVGFIVALYTDSKSQSKKIKEDFLINLKEILYKSRLKYSFDFIEFPEYYSNKIDSLDIARDYLHRSNSHFMIYGRARYRNINGVDSHVLNLNGIVSHKPIPTNLQKEFSTEFFELLPQKLIIKEDDIFSFEITSELINVVAEYIIGIASLLSGDFDYSITLFEDLKVKLQRFQTNLPSIVKIKHRLPKRLAAVYLVKSTRIYESWCSHKNPNLLNEIKIFLDQVEKYSPREYDLHILKSIWYFVCKRDINSAKQELFKNKSEFDYTWCINLAFLFAYEGNLTKAKKFYRLAFIHCLNPNVLFKTEDFIHWVIESEPDKVQLYYCLGLINMRGKGDRIKALSDFEYFLNKVKKSQFEAEQKQVRSYIGSIKSELIKKVV